MGYQTGFICHESLESAENFYFSQVTGVPTDNGLLMPVKSSSGWTFKGDVIHASLPECSPLQNFMDGQEVGWLIVGALSIAWILKEFGRRLL